MSKFNRQIDEAMELAYSLLTKLADGTNWQEEDDLRLEKLNKIISVIAKIKPFKKNEEVVQQISVEEDKEIIKRFIERKVCEMKSLNEAKDL